VLTGTADERALVESLKAQIDAPVVDLCGRTTLWSLGALIEGARLLLCNDTGVSHVAAALGTRSVVVSSGADVARWSPLDRQRHQVLWHDTPCRPCAYRECPWGHPCAEGVSEQHVMRAVAQALAT
jgi:ADP-heptose:LPS heptosyltransferase